MTDIEDLLLSAGVDSAQGRAEALALCFRAMPLRRGESSKHESLEEIFDRGFFLSPEECRRTLDFFGAGEAEVGSAFGIAWPWTRINGAFVAPGLPVRLGDAEEEGADAVYRVAEKRILREAAGEEEIFIDCGASAPGGGFPFDLLCFGAMERYLLKAGRLSIEDLFCRLELPVSRVELDRIFIRGMRMDPALVEGLPGPGQEDAGVVGTVLSISRPLKADFAPDPAVFFGIRADVRELSEKGGELEVLSERGERAVFEIKGGEEFWRVDLREGSYPLHSVNLHRREAGLRLEVEPSLELDLLAPGTRGRLAFDLHSDLVMLEKRYGA